MLRRPDIRVADDLIRPKPVDLGVDAVDTARVSTDFEMGNATGVTPPLILVGDGEVEFFRRLEDVVCALEPVDALDGDYRLFDSKGLVLNVSATAVHRTRWTVSGGRTIVTIPDPHQAQPEVLAGELQAYLVRTSGLADAVTELPSLIELAQANIGFRRPARRPAT